MRVFAILLVACASACSAKLTATVDGAMGLPDLATGGSGGNDDLAGGGASDLAGGGGTPDLGRTFPTDPGTFFGPSRCAQLGALLCEDFEAGNVGDKPNAQLWASSGTVAIDSTHAARGQKALHLQTSSNGWATISETKTFPVANNHFFGRMFFWASGIPTNPSGSHWTVVEGSGTGNGSLIREGGQFDKWGTGSDQGPTGDWTNIDKDPNNAPVPPTLNHWMCIEWEYDGAKNETRFWWDGVEHPSLHETASMHGGNAVPYVMPQFTQLKLGWMLYQVPMAPGPTTFDFWLDEIAIDTARIGCAL